MPWPGKPQPAKLTDMLSEPKPANMTKAECWHRPARTELSEAAFRAWTAEALNG